MAQTQHTWTYSQKVVGSTPGRVAIKWLPQHIPTRRRQVYMYCVVTTRMGDCLWTGEPSRYITNTRVNSAFLPLR